MPDDRSPPSTADGLKAAAPDARARSLFWASAAFYVLIAFEFFYMASPFAAYFYAVYGPGMDGLQSLGFADWTLWFFLPHIVEETRSPLIDHAETLGLILFLGGLAAFAAGAVQVYRAKLLGRGAVMGGLYRAVRHPQYTALIVASLRMLLVWPRFLVLFATVAVIFAYVGLARVEEAACAARLPGYAAYRERTGMFVPRRWTAWAPRLGPRTAGRWQRILVWGAALLVTVTLATVAAFGVRQLTISSLHTHRTAQATHLSVARIAEDDLARVAAIAEGAPAAHAALDALPPNVAIIAYVLPAEMYVSEVPMRLPPGERFGHAVPRDRDPARWKVVFTRAELGAGARPSDDVFARAVNKHPLVEVHVNLATGAVEATHPPPAQPFYAGRQVPVF